MGSQDTWMEGRKFWRPPTPQSLSSEFEFIFLAIENCRTRSSLIVRGKRWTLDIMHAWDNPLIAPDLHIRRLFMIPKLCYIVIVSVLVFVLVIIKWWPRRDPPPTRQCSNNLSCINMIINDIEHAHACMFKGELNVTESWEIRGLHKDMILN